ncbi:MAG: GerAB/ArcD/ProY family transporter [Mycobacterium leprae]
MNNVTPLRLLQTSFGGLLVASLFTLPRSMALRFSTAAPWCILLSGGVACLLVWPVLSAMARRPGSSLTDLALAAGGRPLAIAVTLILAGFLLIGAGLALREVSEMVVTALYPHTPQTFAMATLLVVISLGASIRPAGLLWVGAVYVAPLLLSITAILLGSVGWGQFRNALPLTGHGIVPALAQVIPSAAYFKPLVYLGVYNRYLQTPGRLGLNTLGITMGAAALWSLVTLIYMMVFPLPGGFSVPFPLFELSRLVQGGRFFERMDALWVVFWAFGAACQSAIGIQAAAKLFQWAFRLPEHRSIVPPLAMATVAIALVESNQAGVVRAEFRITGIWEVLVFFVLPAAIALLAMVRGRVVPPENEQGG